MPAKKTPAKRKAGRPRIEIDYEQQNSGGAIPTCALQ